MRFLRSSSSDKGFLLSADVLLAVVLIVGFLGIILFVSLERDITAPISSLGRFGRDVVVDFDENAFLFLALDQNLSKDQTMDAVEQKLASLLSSGMHYRVSLESYSMNALGCKPSQTFEDCFEPESAFPVRGESIPTDRTVASQQMIFFRKGTDAFCSVGKASFSRQPLSSAPEEPFFSVPKEPELLIANFSCFTPRIPEILLADFSDANLAFSVHVNPSGTVDCDQDVRVDLNISLLLGGELQRKPIDMMFLYDKSLSMDECTIAMGQQLDFNSGTIGNGSWKLADAFSLSDSNAFDVLMRWSGACSSPDCPTIVLNSPSDINYGFQFTAPNPIHCSTTEVNYYADSQFNYVAVPRSLSEAGLWRVFVKKTGSLLDYNVQTKIIANKRIDSSSGNIEPLNQPISKIEATKASVVEFNDKAYWSPSSDSFGLSRIGREQGKTQEKSGVELGLGPTHRAAVPSHVKSIGVISVNESAIGLAIQKTTDELLYGAQQNPEAIKVQILLSDGNDTGSLDLNTIIRDAVDKNIVIFAVGFGADANMDELWKIAQPTKGKAYFAHDENALREILDLISIEIGLNARFGIGETGTFVRDANLLVPILPGTTITDFDGGSLYPGQDQNFIFYDIGDLTSLRPSWQGYYVVRYNCDSNYACLDENRALPPNGTVFEWRDGNGSYRDPIFWDSNTTIFVRYRDLTLDVFNAASIPTGGIRLDINAINDGYLSTPTALVEVLYGNPKIGPILRSLPVTAFSCGEKVLGCANYFQLFLDTGVGEEGTLFAVINRDRNIAECPHNNTVEIFCGAALSRFLKLRLWVWR